MRIKRKDNRREPRGEEQVKMRRRKRELMYVDVRLVNDGDD